MNRLLPLIVLLAACAELPDHRPSPEHSTVPVVDATPSSFPRAFETTLIEADEFELIEVEDELRYLVWTRDAEGALATAVVIERREGGYELEQALDGVVMSIDGIRHSYVEEEIEVPLYDCELWEERLDATGTVTRAGIVDELSGETRPLTRALDVEGSADVSQSLTLLGTVGPYAFLNERAYTYACGAHGGIEARFHLIDVRDGSPVDLLSADEHRRVQDAERMEAVAAFGARIDDLVDDAAPNAVTLSQIRPLWTDESLTLEYLFTAPTCYACSDDTWSSYSSGELIEARELPELLIEDAEIPSAVRSYLADHPELNLGGFTLETPLC